MEIVIIRGIFFGAISWWYALIHINPPYHAPEVKLNKAAHKLIKVLNNLFLSSQEELGEDQYQVWLCCRDTATSPQAHCHAALSLRQTRRVGASWRWSRAKLVTWIWAKYPKNGLLILKIDESHWLIPPYVSFWIEFWLASGKVYCLYGCSCQQCLDLKCF
jgi:hypothetical protein